MASIEFLRDQIERDYHVIDNKATPGHLRASAYSRIYNAFLRIEFMERSGLEHDDALFDSVTPSGYPLYWHSQVSELANANHSRKRTATTPGDSQTARREYMDRKAEVQIKARHSL